MFFNRLRSIPCLGGGRRRRRRNSSCCDEILPREPVVLNVYDLVDTNHYTMALGVGFFHSGVQLYGREYGFGGHEFPMSGIFEIQPCNGQAELGEHFRFRESILLGYTHFSSADVQRIVDQLGLQFTGNSYHLTSKNCNHFSNSLVHIVCGRKIPGWVNRLAYLVTCVPFLERYMIPSPAQQQYRQSSHQH
ncbi:deubiquitinase DESI2 [Drosophila biarmipes]|uniref:deubiquitinase DESI2 n=1 Tax=Drosophila biarmipes TaxID=125945 RepID=UPI0007E5EBD0|nr:deubiquitinase DESI2 [Drosophila biarmipes]